MRPEDFKKAWERDGDILVRFSAVELSDKPIPQDAKTFLEAVGLPRDAAPFVGFGARPKGWPIGPEYFEIGSDGAGNPIVLAQNGCILLLDHDLGFQPSYVNRDLLTLVKCLLQFRDVVSEAIKICGPEGITEDPVVLREGVAKFMAMLKTTDRDATAPDAFWAIETENFVLAVES